MPQTAPSRGTPLTSPLALGCVAATLLFGPASSDAAPLPMFPTDQPTATAGLLAGDDGRDLLAAFRQRRAADEFPDLAGLLTPAAAR